MKIMVDGGACIGETLEPYLATHQIFAFEPNPLNVVALHKKFKSYPNFCLLNVALGRELGTATLHDPEQREGVNSSSCTYVPKDSPVGSRGSWEVVVWNLSKFILNEQLAEIDVLKLDIEGAEYDVLEDLLEAQVINRIKTIYVEFHAPKLIPDLVNRDLVIFDRLKAEFEGSLYVWDWTAGKYVLMQK